MRKIYVTVGMNCVQKMRKPEIVNRSTIKRLDQDSILAKSQKQNHGSKISAFKNLLSKILSGKLRKTNAYLCRIEVRGITAIELS